MQGDNRVKHLVVDANAIIRADRLEHVAERYWTVEAIKGEIRDRKARHVLETLPYNLEFREPSPEAVAFIIRFARKTGDLQYLSDGDLEILALTYSLEAEERGTDHLRTEPVAAGARVASSPSTGEAAADVGKAPAAALHIPVSSPGDGPSPARGDGPSEPKAPPSAWKLADPGLSFAAIAARNAPAPAPEETGAAEETEAGAGAGGAEEASEEKGEAGAGAVQGPADTEPRAGAVAGTDSASAQAAGSAAEAAKVAPAEQPSTGPQAVGSEEEEDGGWLEAAASRDREKAEYRQRRQLRRQQQEEARLAKQHRKDENRRKDEAARLAKLRRKEENRRRDEEARLAKQRRKEENRRRDAEARLAKQRGGDSGVGAAAVDAAPAHEEADPASEAAAEAGTGGDAQVAPAPSPAVPARQPASRLVGNVGSAQHSMALEASEIEGTAEDAGDWMGPDNMGSSVATGGWGAAPAVESTRGLAVGCVTSDFAMQNVLLHIGLKLLSIDGKVIRKMRQWVLRCDACGEIVGDNSRLFCPKCGNNTLRRLAVTLKKDGTPVYHYSRVKFRSGRGERYSVPKPRGGRHQELVLREDQLEMGKTRLQANKRSELDCGFGVDLRRELGMRMAVGGNVKVGYGKRNPNQARGRERRGKKKAHTFQDKMMR